ncbi:cupin domain-containing protein [Nocardioides xinjiangensis]|uniref:cupin domain-containing protein n=1 Tax=Nocardioides xinjiangensis TaxID=2817376 RepID=UPI001B30815C|nr:MULTISPECIES: cupin domain-containing protein [unclassified Nocardioides]
MTIPSEAYAVRPGQGRTIDLGVASMRFIASGETTGSAFTVAEMSGTAAGPWTVPHLHRGFEESFYVLDGLFTFSVGDERIEATPGSYVLVPRRTAHVFEAARGGGRFLLLMVPGGLEEMFVELASLSGDAIRDPAVRAAVSSRYDSVPV